MPVYAILCDGEVFEFFCFDGSTKPPLFTKGSDPTIRRDRFRLPEFTQGLSPRPFIDALRPICEITFDLLLNGYLSSLNAYRDRSKRKGDKEGQSRKSLENWDRALGFAQQALRMFRDAEIKRRAEHFDEAEAGTEEAMGSLEDRYDFFNV